MHYKHALIYIYVISVHLIFNNAAINLSYGHRKRELSFSNYPASSSGVDPRAFNSYQRNELNDPGYTRQNDGETILEEKKSTNLSNRQNQAQLLNAPGQMFHLIYMFPNLLKRQLPLLRPGDEVAHPQLVSNYGSTGYTGPHMFPTQLPTKNENIQQLNIPHQNFNSPLENSYSNPNVGLGGPFHPSYFKDTKVATRMEAPFIPSQFLGYGQHQQQPFPQRNQQLTQQYQKVPQQHQQNQLLPLQQQQQLQKPPLNIAPVYEQQENPPHHSPSLVYMAPNNVYNLYRKLN